MEPGRENQNYYNDRVVSVGEWIVTNILLAIPFINIILLLVWGFSDSTPLSKKNYARAVLILMVIGIVLALLFGATIFTAFSRTVRFESTSLQWLQLF